MSGLPYRFPSRFWCVRMAQVAATLLALWVGWLVVAAIFAAHTVVRILVATLELSLRVIEENWHEKDGR